MMSTTNKGFTFGYKYEMNTIKTEGSIPGPGTYNLNDSYESLYKSSKISIGKDKRFIEETSKGNDFIAPGIYNPKIPGKTLPNITFTSGKRILSKNLISQSNLGPGTYDINKFWSSKNNALPFMNAENEEMMKIIHDEITPGPGSYDLKLNDKMQKSLVNYSVHYSKKPLLTIQNDPKPGPGQYEILKAFNSKSISFPKADKNSSFLQSINANINVAPNTYDVKSSSYNFLAKNNNTQISYSFSQSKRLPSLPLQHFQEIFPPIEENHQKGIVFYTAPRNTLATEIDKSIGPGPGNYENEDYWRNVQNKSPTAKRKVKEIIEKINSKSTKGSINLIFKEKRIRRSSSSSRKRSFSKKMKPFMRILTKNTTSLTKTEEISPKKRPNQNHLKSYILKKIQKNVEKKLEKKLNKEIFILSNEAAKKRTNKGFTTSTRKYEFLNLKGQVPGPDKYEINRDLNSFTLPLRTSKKITIFEVENDMPAPNSYNIESPIGKKRPLVERNKTLIRALRKIDEINKRKKNKE